MILKLVLQAVGCHAWAVRLSFLSPGSIWGGAAGFGIGAGILLTVFDTRLFWDSDALIIVTCICVMGMAFGQVLYDMMAETANGFHRSGAAYFFEASADLSEHRHLRPAVAPKQEAAPKQKAGAESFFPIKPSVVAYAGTESFFPIKSSVVSCAEKDIALLNLVIHQSRLARGAAVPAHR